MRARIRNTGHAACWCAGYHYKHRPGSPYCISNPLSIICEVARGTFDDGLGILRAAQSVVAAEPNLADQVRELCATFGIQFNNRKKA